MKKFLQDKVVIIIIILFELIIINEIYQLDDWVKLATIAVPIIMYVTWRETSNSNKKQLEMQTKIALYEKRMKFREELVDFINQKYYHNVKHEISKQEQYYQILQNFYFAIDGLVMTGVGSQESAEEVYNAIEDAHQEAIKLWETIHVERILYSNEFYFSELDFSKLSLNAKLMFEDPKGVITQYFKNINQELGNLKNSLTALYKYRKFIRNLMTHKSDFKDNLLPCLKKVIYKEDLEFSERKICNDLHKLHDHLKQFVEELNNLKDHVQSIPSKDIIDFAEVDKVIQEEAKLLP